MLRHVLVVVAVFCVLSKTVFGPADVARGSFSLSSPMDVPDDRGPLLASIFPAYTPEAGSG